jgi:2-polyprenyl-6-methoxyphenol hydroxylase-like FAD-dependent oxidoreductase
VTRLCDPPLAVLRYPSVAEYRRRIAACSDGSLPLEPYQLVAQNDLEPLLKEVAEATPNVTVRFGCGLEAFTQDQGGVTVNTRTVTGEEHDIRAAYLVGTDGASSTVRKQLGIELQGRGGVGQATQVIFHSDDLFDKIPIGKGRHYNFADERARSLVAQGNRREFTLHSPLPPDSDFDSLIPDLVGFPFDFEIRHVIPWRMHLLVAERFRDRRVFLAGDAVHLVIPAGGLGMNSGVGDAFDLSWKLAGTLHGWGGPGLLDSYEAERRPVALRNVEASGWAAEGGMVWRQLVDSTVRNDGPDGEALRAAIGESFTVNNSRMHGMIGVELGYTYADSPLVADEADNPAQWEISSYTPHTKPGVRLPHLWLSDRRAVQDILGNDYNLLDLTGRADMSEWEAAFAYLAAPLTVIRLDEPHLREVYQRPLLLLRPDLHVAWRGFDPPDDCRRVALMATGHPPGSGG